MDVDIRLLRYFDAVAREGNLTRAAELLFVSQPALSKQIKQLEAHLGAELFVRSRSGMALTEPGRALAARVPAMLADWDLAVREARDVAAREARVVRVGFVATAANEATQRIVAEFGRRCPGWRVDMRKTDWSDPTAGLTDGAVDAALLRLPFPGQDRLRVEVLFSEPRCAVLPASHRLADRGRIAFEELRDEPFVTGPAEAGSARDHWLAEAERGGREPVIGAVARNVDEWLTAIANGDGVALAPQSVARFYPRPGIVFRPVDGIGPSGVAVVWPPDCDGDPALREFIRCCLDEGSTP
ncbi:LysR family transcriptional regulator [Rhodococcus sp. D2-41]|uniref:LysR family transcriptional regulator n=1 Tax=Speluncibacter jeojiensis TaxID=2710754 RepID=A0A9X4M2K1_9ACTN|nr:LysR family transcriptional regulator [Rhodococcus sp. D2-41]MDG3011299.1 LysR family transcriptional regulator [Rhodococcus sp. D2-41]MDG3015850.1 LysR family transcriptional regulator [Corynebacteriales bacterium D3-21]